MKSNYKPIGDYVKQVKLKNKDNSLTVEHLRGIRINKEFMPSVANVTGTDLSKYRVVKKHQFAYNPMHVGRDEILPISMLNSEDAIIVSPAYIIFEITDTSELLPEYLMIWCRRSEFDRNAWFTTDSSVRGGFSWDDFCGLELPIPSIEKQASIVKEYHTITDRIKLNEQLNQKLEDTTQAIYKEWFVDFEFPNEDGKPYKSSGGEMVFCDELDMEIPEGWKISSLSLIATYLNGLAMQKFEPETEEFIPVIKIKELNQGYTDINSGRAKINIPKDYIINNSDVVFSWSASLKVDIWCGGIGGLNQHLFKVTSDKYNKWFYYLWTKYHLSEFIRIADGNKTSMGHIKREHLDNAKVLIPTDKQFLKMDKIMNKILNNIILYKKEKLKLNQFKEILLSKMATIEG